MKPNHRELFEPLTVRHVTLRNRIVAPPMCQLRDIASAQGVRWYRRLAAGGAGLVIIEGTSVFRFHDGDLTARTLAPVVDAIHEEGAAAAIQLFAIPRDWPAEPNELSRQQIETIIQQYGLAAGVCRQAGLEAVEPHGAHGFVLNRFFMPDRNSRDDEFGGSFANRCRLGLAIVQAIRQGAGCDMLVFYRHSPEGSAYTLQDSLDFARELVAAGVDVLDISPARKDRVGDLAEPFKALGVPVLAVNGMDDPDAAAAAIRDGRCDLVGVGRQLIADAAWPRKVQAERFDRIVLCRKCDVGCYGAIRQGRQVECVAWPEEEQTVLVHRS